MFSVLRKYEDRLARAELNQIESLRIMKKLELEADKVKDLVTQVVSCLDTLLREIDQKKRSVIFLIWSYDNGIETQLL